MFDVFMDYVKKALRSRLWPIVTVYTLLFVILVSRMYDLQIKQPAESGTLESDAPMEPKQREINAIRANIYDKNDALLAYNELSYTITFEDRQPDVDLPKKEANQKKNEMIHNMIQILEENGNELKTLEDFPIQMDKREDDVLTLWEGTAANGVVHGVVQAAKNAGKGKKIQIDGEVAVNLGKKEGFRYTVKDNALLTFLREAYFKKSTKDLTEEEKATTAEELFHYFRTDVSSSGPQFDVGKEYTNEEALKILSVRYAMLVNRTQKYIPITLATNVNAETVAAISENKADIPGVDVTMDTHRVYNEALYLSHILGYTGKISAEELEQSYDEEGNTVYNSNDFVGKAGVEKRFESVLKGEKGLEEVVLDANSRVQEISSRTEPVKGKDVYLTIDSELQKACYDILEKKLAGILLSKINNSKSDVGTKGESANDIKIPIYDVYSAIMCNNVVDVSKFEDKKATNLERSVYHRFLVKQKSVMNSIESMLGMKNRTPVSSLGEDSQEYLDYIFERLLENGMILKEKVGNSSKDDIYRSEDGLFHYNRSSSLGESLQDAFVKGQINLDMLNTSERFYGNDELYKRLLKYITNTLKNDANFHKILYRSMVFSDNLSGREICILLYEQNVLQYEEDKVEGLRNGTISPYDFLRSKIKSREVTPAMLALEPCSGSVVITDAQTGQVRALVSYPSYDDTKFANSINAEYYSYVTNNAASPLLNRPMQQSTAPGSTFKMVSAVAALEEGVINTYSTVHDEVTFDKVEPPPKCWSTSGHGTINVEGAICHSCNYFFYEMGYRMSSAGGGKTIHHNRGLATLQKYAEMFGFGKTSGVELVESVPNISDTDAIRSAIGQGTNNYTPIQLSRYVTTIANGGYCNELTIIDSKKSKLKKEENAKKKAKRMNVRESTWNAVWQGMRRVVSEGTISPLFADMPVDVAGKTGTAQESKSKPNHALFVSFAPYDDPEITVTTVIPNGYTSSNAAELARDVYRYYYGDAKAREDFLKSEVTGPEMEGQAFSD